MRPSTRHRRILWSPHLPGRMRTRRVPRVGRHAAEPSRREIGRPDPTPPLRPVMPGSPPHFVQPGEPDFALPGLVPPFFLTVRTGTRDALRQARRGPGGCNARGAGPERSDGDSPWQEAEGPFPPRLLNRAQMRGGKPGPHPQDGSPQMGSFQQPAREGAIMHVLVVTIDIKPEFTERFIAAMLDDARGSVRNEPGCVRFDVIQAASGNFPSSRSLSSRACATRARRSGCRSWAGSSLQSRMLPLGAIPGPGRGGAGGRGPGPAPAASLRGRHSRTEVGGCQKHEGGEMPKCTLEPHGRSTASATSIWANRVAVGRNGFPVGPALGHPGFGQFLRCPEGPLDPHAVRGEIETRHVGGVIPLESCLVHRLDQHRVPHGCPLPRSSEWREHRSESPPCQAPSRLRRACCSASATSGDAVNRPTLPIPAT